MIEMPDVAKSNGVSPIDWQVRKQLAGDGRARHRGRWCEVSIGQIGTFPMAASADSRLIGCTRADRPARARGDARTDRRASGSGRRRAMGFLPQDADALSSDEIVRVRVHPAWLRVDARFGTVYRRLGDPAMVLR